MTTVIQSGKKLIIDGKEYDLPKKKKWNDGCSVSLINGKVYVDGFELIDGEWKRTLKALFHYIF
jgi:hypothetical protein